MKDLKQESISRIELFRSCSPAQIRSIAKIGDWVDVAEGTVLAHEGRRAGEFVVLLDGKAAATDSDGMSVLEDGSFFGQVELAGDTPHRSSIHMLTAGRLLVFETRAFRSLIESVPSVAWKLMSDLARASA
jgi:CRP-like cAMP-binding protein